MRKIVSVLMLVFVLFLSGCGNGDTGPQGVQGPQGIQGEKGDKGDPGANGFSFLAGDGTPSPELGGVGDSYLDRLTGDFYGPKTAEGWAEPVKNLFTGPAGADGEVGPPGDPGPPGPGAIGTWVFTGKGKPSSTVAIVGSRPGDLYIDLNCGEVFYLKVSPATWIKIGELD